MPTQKNPWFILVVVILTMVLIACSCGTIIPSLSAPTTPATPSMPGLEGFWQFSNKVYSIARQNDQYVVTSVTDTEEGALEITSQSWNGSRLTWTYFRPSNGWSITYTTTAISGDGLYVDYSNETGVLGSRTLRRIPSAQATYDSLPYTDNFSDPNSGWESIENADGAAGYSNGSYVSVAKTQGFYVAGSLFRFWGDSVIEVDATPASGPGNNNFGYAVECHIRNDGRSYTFEVTADGYYSVYRVTGFDPYTFTSLLPGVEYLASSAINQGLATNHLAVTCAGNQLKLEVNGQVLFEGQDSSFSDGHISLSAITFEDNDTPAEVHFDDLLVRAP
jgi:hypothetical protein